MQLNADKCKAMTYGIAKELLLLDFYFHSSHWSLTKLGHLSTPAGKSFSEFIVLYYRDFKVGYTYSLSQTVYLLAYYYIPSEQCIIQ